MNPSISSLYLTWYGLKFLVSKFFNKLSKPFLFLALVPTTGTPKICDNWLKFIFIFFFSASSNKFTQTITFLVISNVWSTKLRFRSKQTASQTTITKSYLSKQRKSRAISSSFEWGIKE